jgi:hypothetical protein
VGDNLESLHYDNKALGLKPRPTVAQIRALSRQGKAIETHPRTYHDRDTLVEAGFRITRVAPVKVKKSDLGYGKAKKTKTKISWETSTRESELPLWQEIGSRIYKIDGCQARVYLVNGYMLMRGNQLYGYLIRKGDSLALMAINDLVTPRDHEIHAKLADWLTSKQTVLDMKPLDKLPRGLQVKSGKYKTRSPR